jgi:hypothetical protein
VHGCRQGAQLVADNLVGSPLVLQHLTHEIEFAGQQLLLSQLTFSDRLHVLRLATCLGFATARREDLSASLGHGSGLFEGLVDIVVGGHTEGVALKRTVGALQVVMGGLAVETAVLSSVKGVDLDNSISVVVGNHLGLQVLGNGTALIKLVVALVGQAGRSLDSKVRVDESIVAGNSLHALGIEDRSILVDLELGVRLNLLVKATVHSSASKFVCAHSTLLGHGFSLATSRLLLRKMALDTGKGLLGLILNPLLSTAGKLAVVAILFAIVEIDGVGRNTEWHSFGCSDVRLAVV